MDQFSAITPFQKRPAQRRRMEIDAKSQYIPEILGLQETKRQNEISNRFARENLNLRQQDYEDSKDARKKANTLSRLGLGLTAAKTLNDITDDGVVDFGKRALEAVTPNFDIAPANDHGGFATGNVDMGFGGGETDFDWNTITQPVQEVATDFGKTVASGAKKLYEGSGMSGLVSDVTGYASDLWDNIFS